MLRRTTWFPTKVKGNPNSTDKFDIRLDFTTAQTAPITSYILKCTIRADIAKCRLGAQKYVTLIHDECPEYVVCAFGYLSGFNLAPSSYVFLDSLLKALKTAKVSSQNHKSGFDMFCM